jgi:hypothetical protein
VVGHAERELDRHVGRRDAELAARAQAGLGLELGGGEPLADELVAAERGGVDDLDAERAHLVGVEHADGRRAPPVHLQVQERVDDRLGDDVEEVGGVLRRSVDQDGHMASNLAITSPTCRV